MVPLEHVERMGMYLLTTDIDMWKYAVYGGVEWSWWENPHDKWRFEWEEHIYIPSGKLTCWSWKSAIFRWKLVFQPGLMAGSMLFWMVHGRWGYHHDWWAQMGMQSMYRSKNLQYLHWWKSTGWWFGTMEFYDLPYIGNKHPNWLSYFQRGWNHQPVYVGRTNFCIWCILLLKHLAQLTQTITMI